MNLSQFATDLKPTPAKLFVVGLIVLGWVLMSVHSMHSMGQHEMHMGWTSTDFIGALFMWLIMVLAMMIPTLMPMFKAGYGQAMEFRPTVRFTFGYFVAWAGFCIAATALQYGLKSNALLDMYDSTSAVWLSAVVLIGAGLFQFIKAKQVYLKACQLSLKRLKKSVPAQNNFVFKGLSYGTDCIKCCWPMMLTMFVFGLMNIFAMAGLTAIMIAEKTVQQTEIFTKVVGGLFIIAGLAVLIM